MEFFESLKKFIPSVLASESKNINGKSAQNDGQVKHSLPDEFSSPAASGVESKKATETEEITINTKPEQYSDVLVENGTNSKYFMERGNKRYQPKWSRRFLSLEGRENMDRFFCEKKIYNITQEEPLVKLMIGALNSSGCMINLARNFACEVCCNGVLGGYDAETQQVVICQNNLTDVQKMTTVLTHELIHMFDHCVNKTDFKTSEHLACTEIRAINLTSCSLADAFFSGFVSPLELITRQYRKKHALCVKERALQSVLAASTLSEEEARKVIDKVFPQCYNDLEPVGRRLRNKSTDGDRAYYDGQHYGYV